MIVGELKEGFLKAAAAEYLRRLSGYAQTELVAVRSEPLPPGFGPADGTRIKEIEGERLLGFLEEREYIVALDREGRQFSSEELAGWLDDLALAGQSRWAFTVGGPLGLSPRVLGRAHARLSLSRMTFPHQLVPVIVLEQLYRAFRIRRGEPYHK